jgi:hypothetical protein
METKHSKVHYRVHKSSQLRNVSSCLFYFYSEVIGPSPKLDDPFSAVSYCLLTLTNCVDTKEHSELWTPLVTPDFYTQFIHAQCLLCYLFKLLNIYKLQ